MYFDELKEKKGMNKTLHLTTSDFRICYLSLMSELSTVRVQISTAPSIQKHNKVLITRCES